MTTESTFDFDDPAYATGFADGWDVGFDAAASATAALQGLSGDQLDGLACAVCGAPFRAAALVSEPMTADGRRVLFACWPACAP